MKTLWALTLLTLLCASMQAQTLTTLYSFKGKADEGYPNAGVVLDSQDNVYGTTSAGGGVGKKKGQGVIYRVASDRENAIIKFNSKDGKLPQGGLAQDGSGNLYGTTLMGGTYDRGTIYELEGSTLTVLHSFTGQADGRWPSQGVAVSSGEIYGTSDAVVFRLDKSGFTILHTFTGGKNDAIEPSSAPILDAQANLYGTTSGGGAYGYGVLYEIDTNNTFSILHNFGPGNDGYGAEGPLTFDSSGNLYGTTYHGGDSNCGVLYEYAQGQETILHTFQDNGVDGCVPSSGVIFDASGNLYGSTLVGGSAALGTVYTIVQGQETILHNFVGADGSYPQGLALDSAGDIYGATSSGGVHGFGTVFKIAQ